MGAAPMGAIHLETLVSLFVVSTHLKKTDAARNRLNEYYVYEQSNVVREFVGRDCLLVLAKIQFSLDSEVAVFSPRNWRKSSPNREITRVLKRKKLMDFGCSPCDNGLWI